MPTWNVRYLLAACVVIPIGCSGAGTEQASKLPDVFPLPFALHQAPGTMAIGRPAIFNQPGEPGSGVPKAKSLTAVYVVTAEDPLEPLRDWAAQAADLRPGELDFIAGAGTAVEPWAALRGSPIPTDGTLAGDSVDIFLWRTTKQPLLVVNVTRFTDERPDLPPGRKVVIPAALPSASGPPLRWRERAAGDVLFTRQDETMRLPSGATSTAPSAGGISVLRATDPKGVVERLLSDAKASQARGASVEVDGPVVATDDALTTRTARFYVGGGGWGFSVVAIKAAQDDVATIVVTDFEG